MANHKHLSYDDRLQIAAMLNERASFREIGIMLDKDPTTISKEIRSHTIHSKVGCMGNSYNNCVHQLTCSRTHVCTNCLKRRLSNRCRFCSDCNDHCCFYEPAVCHRNMRPPYVCNGCPDKHHTCRLEKKLYIPKEAQNAYIASLHDSRQGFCLSEEEVRHLDKLFSPLLKKSQSVHHIFVHHADEIMVSQSSIYRLIDQGAFEARNIDLPRKVRFSKRKKQKNHKVDTACRNGRTYECFQAFRKENPHLPVTEMDSVEGKKGGKVLLTIHFVKAECMLAFLRDANDAKSVSDAFSDLYASLGQELYRKLFPVLLGDNGSEFSNPLALEFDENKERRSYVFYCDPSAPGQKGSAERNHEFIRMFIPKGTSMDNRTQEDISLMMDHINSYSRPELGDKSPYEMMSFFYGEQTCRLLGMHLIPSDDITLNNSIFRKEDGDGLD